MGSERAWLRTDGGAADLAGLTGEQLRAVAALWARSRREVSARFGGTSMEPTIAPGAEVVLACGGDPRVGDVIAYVMGDQVVVHRLEARARGGWLLTRGDAHVAPDLPVRAADLLGRVAAVAGPDGPVATPPAPRTMARGAALAACRLALAVHPRACVFAVRALRWTGRRLGSRTAPPSD
jgi:hypothetical protein